MVSESNCKSLYADLCKKDTLFHNDNMFVTSNEIEEKTWPVISPLDLMV